VCFWAETRLQGISKRTAETGELTQKVLIGVVGSGEEDAELSRISEEVGARIARSGSVLVNGGLGGVMRASAKGSKEAGGLTIGILPGWDIKEANPYIDITIPTGMGEMRNVLIVRASRGLIAVGGGYGTLSEIALALKTGKPVVGLKSWGVSQDIVQAEDPAQAVDLLLKAI
jgi:uncharacterized protein (TIGR00725 family)